MYSIGPRHFSFERFYVRPGRKSIILHVFFRLGTVPAHNGASFQMRCDGAAGRTFHPLCFALPPLGQTHDMMDGRCRFGRFCCARDYIIFFLLLFVCSAERVCFNMALERQGHAILEPPGRIIPFRGNEFKLLATQSTIIVTMHRNNTRAWG